MDKEMIDAFINEIKTDNDFAFLVFYCFGTGLRELSAEVENGRNDDVAQVYGKCIKKIGDKYSTIH
jgi:hypothetical protein